MTTPETTIETSALQDYAPVPRSAIGSISPGSNLTEDIPGCLEAPANALAYSWKHFIGGHVGRLGTRDDVQLHQQYMADISESSRKAIDAVDPRRYYAHYGENKWAAAKGHLDETTRLAAGPVMESIRLNLGYGSQVHP